MNETTLESLSAVVAMVLAMAAVFVLLALLGTLDSTNLRNRAGVLKPLLQLLQPSVDNRLADQRRTPAAQAIDREWVSETLIRETSRSGQEWSMLTELLGGQIGDIPTW